MKILNWEIKKVARASASDDLITFNIAGEFIKADLTSYSTLSGIRNEVINKLFEEIYPDVKDALLKHSGMQKIITEIRLDLAKKINN